MLSPACSRSTGRTSILSARSSRSAAMRTLRTKGEKGEERKSIMAIGSAAAGAGCIARGCLLSNLKSCAPLRWLAGNDQVHGFRAFALFIRFDVEADLLPLVQALEACLFDGRDVHEHVASAVVRFHKAVAALAIEELHNASLRHRETPRTASATGPTHGGSAQHS